MRAAIIGLGVISEVHSRALSACGIELAAVCDIDPVKLKTYTVPGYTDYRQLLQREDVDVVHICTPHYLHVPMALDALEAGKYVLLEKPAATSEGELQKLISAPGVQRLGVCFQNRYNPATVRAKQMIDSGEYGKITGVLGLVPWYREAEYYQNSPWRGKLKTEGGCLLVNQAIHTIDLMQYLGGPVAAVQGHVANFTHQGVIEGEDAAMAALTYQSGVTGMFFATNSFCSGSSVRIELTLERAKLLLTQQGLFVDGKMVEENKKAAAGKSYYGSAHTTLISEFYQLIQGQGGNRISIEEALPACKIIEGIYRSSAQNIVCQL